MINKKKIIEIWDYLEGDDKILDIVTAFIPCWFCQQDIQIGNVKVGQIAINAYEVHLRAVHAPR